MWIWLNGDPHSLSVDFHFVSWKPISFEAFEGESWNQFGWRRKWPTKPCQHEHELRRPSQPQSSPRAAETQRWNGVAKLKQLMLFNLPHGSSWWCGSSVCQHEFIMVFIMVFTIIILAHGDWLLLSQHMRTLCASPLTLASAACRAASASCVSPTESGCFHVFLQRSRFESVWKRWPCSKSSHFTRTKQDKIDASMRRCVAVAAAFPCLDQAFLLRCSFLARSKMIKASKCRDKMWQKLFQTCDTFWHVLTYFKNVQKGCDVSQIWRLLNFDSRGSAVLSGIQRRSVRSTWILKFFRAKELSEITTGPPLLFLPPW